MARFLDTEIFGHDLGCTQILERIGKGAFEVGKERLGLFAVLAADVVVVGFGPIRNGLRRHRLFKRLGQGCLDGVGRAVMYGKADGLFQRQHIGQPRIAVKGRGHGLARDLDTVGGEHGQRLELAALDQRRLLGERGHHQRHLTGNRRFLAGGRALVGDELEACARALFQRQNVQVVDRTGPAGGGGNGAGRGFGGVDQVGQAVMRAVGGHRDQIGRAADDEGIPEVELLVPAALDRGGDVGFRQPDQRIAVVGLIGGIDKPVRARHAAGLVDHVDRDRKMFLHLGHDHPVDRVGAAAGPPDHGIGDVAIGIVLRHGAAGHRTGNPAGQCQRRQRAGD